MKNPGKEKGRFLAINRVNHKWLASVGQLLYEKAKSLFSFDSINVKDWIVTPDIIEISSRPIITWLGHSTFLIQIAGKNILTDPIFGRLSFIFSRQLPSVLTIEELPKIDYVVISHNHLDHMDASTLCVLRDKFPEMHVFVPSGDKEWFDKRGFASCSEHVWWEQIVTKDKRLIFTFLPANHWSQRGLFDKNKSLWGSWMIQNAQTSIYFAGDTGWGTHFESIGKAFRCIDVALMPIAPAEPKKFMQYAHVNAEEAVEAFFKLKARYFVPMHWGTYRLGMDTFCGPIERLVRWWKRRKSACRDKVLKIMKVGESLRCKGRRVTKTMLFQSKFKKHKLFSSP